MTGALPVAFFGRAAAWAPKNSPSELALSPARADRRDRDRDSCIDVSSRHAMDANMVICPTCRMSVDGRLAHREKHCFHWEPETSTSTCGRVDLDKLLAHRVYRSRRARLDAETVEDVHDMVLDRAFAEGESLRDRPVREAIDEEPEDLHLARGEIVARFRGDVLHWCRRQRLGNRRLQRQRSSLGPGSFQRIGRDRCRYHRDSAWPECVAER